MIQKCSAILLLTLLIASKVHSGKVQCQTEPSNWKPGQRFQLSQRQVLVPTIYEGVELFVDKFDGFVSKLIINSGSWQPRNLRNMARFVQPGYTFLNVGTHVGIEAVVLGKILGKNGRLFMFQPFSVSHNLALKNVYFNGLADIATVFNAGAGSSYSKAIEVIDMDNTGGSRIYTSSKNKGDPSKNQQVVVDVLDDVLPSDILFDFVLIDVERMELQVFLGMKDIILRSPNIIIMCEWSGTYFDQFGEGQKMIEVVNWFVQHKFKFYEMAPGQARCQYATWIEQTPQQVLKKGNYPDILFVPSHIDPNKVGL